MFTLAPDRKQRVMQLLKDALAALEEGRIEVVEDVLTGYNSDGMGYTRHKDTLFFGMEYKILPRKTVPAVTAVTAPAVRTGPRIEFEQPDPSPSLYTPKIQIKLGSTAAQRLFSNGQYTCPKCNSFSTTSETGIKKHYNRCNGSTTTET
jgi:hypothetical protein